MWLLNTARAELAFFPTPESVPGGYAILSHVWDAKEESFHEVQALRSQCSADGTNPRDYVSDKIREFFIVTERDGYKWGWADTCSSTELSEAINSMYRYYALAGVCYAYLGDVPTSDRVLPAPNSAFRKSRWHHRGWTLQELVAPRLVILLSKTWEPLAFCVAIRMAWAAGRQTTRSEDEAYCLMGIFMPALYGEGRNAFLRLQEEIMRQEDDSSLFAWGDIYGLDESTDIASKALKPSAFNRDHLFARSPSDFHIGHHMRCRNWYSWSRPSLWERFRRMAASAPDLLKLPTFNVTPYGVVAQLPVIVRDGQFLIAPLPLGMELPLRPQGKVAWNVGLLLRMVDSPDPTRPRYAPQHLPHSAAPGRLIELVGDPFELAARSKSTIEWRTIYILHRPPREELQDLSVASRSMRAPFQIPRWLIAGLLRDSTVTDTTFQEESNHFFFEELERNGASLRLAITPPGTSVQFKFVVHLGLCDKADGHHGAGNDRHWAIVTAWSDVEPYRRYEHVCAEHHVHEWQGRTRAFTIESDSRRQPQQLRVELAFEPYAHNPRRVLKVTRISFKTIDSATAGSTSKGRRDGGERDDGRS
ncbi:hypothetical protein V8D89_002496 [Ganoderma adspersum]